MSTTRINELPAAASVNSGDFLAIDNTSGVSQKITAEQLLNVDPTLSVAGRPADAKATGDAISAEADARMAVGEEVSALNSAIETEATAREAADNELKSALAEDDVLFKLHAEEIDGTTQTVVYENGQIKRILHKYSNNDQLVRTDAYTFGDTQIVETRTLATGDTMTITTNLSTLQTTVQTILVPAV